MTDLERAKQIFESDVYAFVIVRDGQVAATGKREGIGELLDAIEQFRDAVQGAALADKIVGKAVAMSAVYAGIRAVYTPLASQPAQDVLDAYGVEFRVGRLVPLIRNKRNDGPCPMERLTMEVNDPFDAVSALREFVSSKPVRSGEFSSAQDTQLSPK